MRKEEHIKKLENKIAALETQIKVWQDEINKLEGLCIFEPQE